MGVKVSGELND